MAQWHGWFLHRLMAPFPSLVAPSSSFQSPRVHMNRLHGTSLHAFSILQPIQQGVEQPSPIVFKSPDLVNDGSCMYFIYLFFVRVSWYR